MNHTVSCGCFLICDSDFHILHKFSATCLPLVSAEWSPSGSYCQYMRQFSCVKIYLKVPGCELLNLHFHLVCREVAVHPGRLVLLTSLYRRLDIVLYSVIQKDSSGPHIIMRMCLEILEGEKAICQCINLEKLCISILKLENCFLKFFIPPNILFFTMLNDPNALYIPYTVGTIIMPFNHYRCTINSE